LLAKEAVMYPSLLHCFCAPVSSHGLYANACHPADAVPPAPITPGRAATDQCLVEDMRSQGTANTAANTEDLALLCHLVTCTHTCSDGASTTFRLGHKRRLPDAIMGVRQHLITSSNHITAATNCCATGARARAPEHRGPCSSRGALGKSRRWGVKTLGEAGSGGRAAAAARAHAVAAGAVTGRVGDEGLPAVAPAGLHTQPGLSA